MSKYRARNQNVEKRGVAVLDIPDWSDCGLKIFDRVKIFDRE
jgi:hypothetical protein